MPRRADTQENTNTAEPMEQQVPFEVTITEHNPERGVLATADVKVGNMMTIRNVKIKEDDYGLTVTMPRTKVPHAEQYKDSYRSYPDGVTSSGYVTYMDEEKISVVFQEETDE